MKQTTIGYLVLERCDDYEQALALEFGDDKPAAGVLGWAGKRPATVFPSHKAARDAITRTHHWGCAFRQVNVCDPGVQVPARGDCYVKPLVAAPGAAIPDGGAR